MIRKLLIANRGEIAVRIIYAAREMGIRSVAVYSDADRAALHSVLADEALAIGSAEPSASYLNIERILDAAKAAGCDAVHPGYGFLSERAEFSEACEQAGLVFVGPPPSAMRALGSKIDAKKIAVTAGVPITPGFFEKGASTERLALAANEIGYPVMLKASAGGGGRGMRVVRSPDDFDAELRHASEEALMAFGDGTMMVEKLVERPRHIEVQILADRHGNVACLFERECSIQRRHQKLIEEAPSPVGGAIWPGLRDAAESLAKAAGYTNAGTVEFMLDQTTGQFFFLEVNARLQVEHPVTEMITGVDLVQWQIRIASGESLSSDAFPRHSSAGASRAAINGHAIEARVVAEDPAHNFLPSIGRIAAWAEPKRPGIRIDTGFGPGAEVSRFYDSLIAKVISHGETRLQAITRLREALLDFHILGVKTNIGYLVDVLSHPGFLAGEIDTAFLGREFPEWKGTAKPYAELANILEHGVTANEPSLARAGAKGVWGVNDGFRN